MGTNYNHIDIPKKFITIQYVLELKLRTLKLQKKYNMSQIKQTHTNHNGFPKEISIHKYVGTFFYQQSREKIYI